VRNSENKIFRQLYSHTVMHVRRSVKCHTQQFASNEYNFTTLHCCNIVCPFLQCGGDNESITDRMTQLSPRVYKLFHFFGFIQLHRQQGVVYISGGVGQVLFSSCLYNRRLMSNIEAWASSPYVKWGSNPPFLFLPSHSSLFCLPLIIFLPPYFSHISPPPPFHYRIEAAAPFTQLCPVRSLTGN